MYTVNVIGFDTKEQAEAFVQWYENSGEQTLSEVICDSNPELNIDHMNTDMKKYSLDWNGNTITLPLVMGYLDSSN